MARSVWVTTLGRLAVAVGVSVRHLMVVVSPAASGGCEVPPSATPRKLGSPSLQRSTFSRRNVNRPGASPPAFRISAVISQ